MKVIKVIMMVSIMISSVVTQQAGTATENQPPIQVQECTSSGCRTISTSVTIDANWRWSHKAGTNCYSGSEWNTAFCPDPATCAINVIKAANCAVEGVNTNEYAGTYGITSQGSELKLGFVTRGQYSTNIGSRVFLMENQDTYQVFKLLNKEFTFDVDDSQLECGLNGAVYFVEMAADGGKGAYSGNKAGAKFGTGYCDAQCPHDIKFINGEANTIEWSNAKGQYGSCCAEMDIWEANKISTAFTPHPCSVTGAYRCNGNDCGDGANRYGGVCDKDGCDFNSFRQGNKTFYGAGKIVDTNLPVTVVTQFITDDNTDNGNLVEIRRIYKQNNKVIHNSATTFPSLNGATSITDGYCDAQKDLFGDTDHFTQLGGLREMGNALKRGMVLALSLWVDYDANLLWLDGNFPTSANPSTPGVARGECSATSGIPANVIAQHPNAKVTFGNIKWGAIGSTTPTGPYPTNPTSNPTNNPTNPTSNPTNNPTNPTSNPTNNPNNPTNPTSNPTNNPTNPTSNPTNNPTNPTSNPTNNPTNPTSNPTNNPTNPTSNPTNNPTNPTSNPTVKPTVKPTSNPSSSGEPSKIEDSSASFAFVSLSLVFLGLTVLLF